MPLAVGRRPVADLLEQLLPHGAGKVGIVRGDDNEGPWTSDDVLPVVAAEIFLFVYDRQTIDGDSAATARSRTRSGRGPSWLPRRRRRR